MKTTQAISAFFKASARKLAITVNECAKDYFAPYIIRDNHGTHILCWTMKQAQEWLPYCSKNAEIVDSYDYKMMIARKQGI